MKTITMRIQTAFDAWLANPTFNVLHALRNEISTTLTRIHKGTSWTGEETVLCQLLPTILPVLDKHHIPLNMNEEKRLVKLLCRDDNYLPFLDSPESEQQLALLCVDVAFDAEVNGRRDRDLLLSKLLLQWTGYHLPKPRQPTPEKVIDLLYGNGAWDLVFQGDKTYDAILNTFKTLNLPVRRDNNRQSQSGAQAALILPDDLSL